MANNTSQHILNTSANLLGFCLFVITSLHVTDLAEARIIDELTAVVAVLLTISCICSFISIRTTDPGIERKFETVADYLFLIALIGILVTILMITFDLVDVA